MSASGSSATRPPCCHLSQASGVQWELGACEAGLFLAACLASGCEHPSLAEEMSQCYCYHPSHGLAIAEEKFQSVTRPHRVKTKRGDRNQPQFPFSWLLKVRLLLCVLLVNLIFSVKWFLIILVGTSVVIAFLYSHLGEMVPEGIYL